jgi:hypothetical protein
MPQKSPCKVKLPDTRTQISISLKFIASELL